MTNSNSFNTPEIIGIAIGSGIGVTTFAGITYCYLNHRKKRDDNNQSQTQPEERIRNLEIELQQLRTQNRLSVVVPSYQSKTNTIPILPIRKEVNEQYQTQVEAGPSYRY
jgi:hypothetical protein